MSCRPCYPLSNCSLRPSSRQTNYTPSCSRPSSCGSCVRPCLPSAFYICPPYYYQCCPCPPCRPCTPPCPPVRREKISDFAGGGASGLDDGGKDKKLIKPKKLQGKKPPPKKEGPTRKPSKDKQPSKKEPTPGQGGPKKPGKTSKGNEGGGGGGGGGEEEGGGGGDGGSGDDEKEKPPQDQRGGGGGGAVESPSGPDKPNEMKRPSLTKKEVGVCTPKLPPCPCTNPYCPSKRREPPPPTRPYHYVTNQRRCKCKSHNKALQVDLGKCACKKHQKKESGVVRCCRCGKKKRTGELNCGSSCPDKPLMSKNCPCPKTTCAKPGEPIVSVKTKDNQMFCYHLSDFEPRRCACQPGPRSPKKCAC